MARTREMVNISMDMKMHRKLTLISFMKQFRFNEKLSMSEIVNKALVEYLDNHADEFTDAIEECRKRGWDL